MSNALLIEWACIDAIQPHLEAGEQSVGPRPQRLGAAALLEEVREFHAAGLCADFYDSFDVNSKDFMAKSEGTDEFRGARETERAPRWRG